MIASADPNENKRIDKLYEFSDSGVTSTDAQTRSWTNKQRTENNISLLSPRSETPGSDGILLGEICYSEAKASERSRGGDNLTTQHTRSSDGDFKVICDTTCDNSGYITAARCDLDSADYRNTTTHKGM